MAVRHPGGAYRGSRHHGRVSPLPVDRYRTELETHVAALAESLRGVDLARTVVTCPEWSLAVLARHVGVSARWTAELVARRATALMPMADVADTAMPDGDDPRSRWLAASARRLVDAVRDAPADARIWTFVGPRPAIFWLRRITGEAAVHRADVALTLGRPFELAPEVAADLLSEGLGLLADRGGAAGRGETLHFHATDGLGEAGEWLVRRSPDGIEVERRHARADVAVRGPATELLLVLLGRLPPTHPGMHVLGDESVLATWLEDTRFG